MWNWVTQCVLAMVYGIAGGIIPVFNIEAYLVATVLVAHAHPIATLIGLSLGSGIGKTIIFLLVRSGKRLPWWKPTPSIGSEREAAVLTADPQSEHPVRRVWWRHFVLASEGLLDFVGTPRWGIPLVGLSAAASIPPVYAVTVLAGASTMKTLWFAIVVTFGSLVRYSLVLAVALGVLSVI